MELLILLTLLIATYVGWSLYVTRKIDRSNYEKKQKRTTHKLLTWLLPFIGSVVVISSWQINNSEQPTEQSSDKKGFHESGKGIYPPGHDGEFDGDSGFDIGGGGTGIGGDA